MVRPYRPFPPPPPLPKPDIGLGFDSIAIEANDVPTLRCKVLAIGPDANDAAMTLQHASLVWRDGEWINATRRAPSTPARFIPVHHLRDERQWADRFADALLFCAIGVAACVFAPHVLRAVLNG